MTETHLERQDGHEPGAGGNRQMPSAEGHVSRQRSSGHHRHHRHHHSSGGMSRLHQHVRRTLDKIMAHLGELPFWGSLLLLALFPLAMGGGELWAVPAALTWCLVLYVCWGLSATWVTQPCQHVRWHWLYVLPLLLLLVGLLQYCPSGFLSDIVGAGAKAYWQRLEAIGVLSVTPSISIAPDITWRYCGLVLLLGLLMVLLVSHCHGRVRVLSTALAVILAAVINALVAYYPFFFDRALFYWQRDLEPDVLSGAFLNRNHFGFLMGMGSLVTIGVIFAAFHSRQRVQAKSSKRSHKRFMLMIIPLVVCWFLLQVSQVFSLSRGAFMATVPLSLVFLLSWLFRPRGPWRLRQAGTRHNVLIAVGVIVCALFVALPEALPRLSERYERLVNDQTVTMDTRYVLWRESLPIIRDYWLAGVGLGNYAQVMTQYESDYTPMTLPVNAHNDWLELIIEVGVPVALVLYGTLVYFLVCAFRGLWRQNDSILRWIGFGALAAIGMGMIHELVDYSLRAPGNALIYAALMVLVIICSRSEHKQVSQPGPRGQLGQLEMESAKPAFVWRRGPQLLLGCMAVLALPTAYRHVLSRVLEVRVIEAMSAERRAQEKRYPLLKNEYRRLALMTERIQELTPGRGDVLRRQAECLNHLAFLSWAGSVDSIVESLAYSQQAIAAIRQACSRYPLDGRFHQTHAVILENYGWCSRNYDEQAIARAYEQALACYPRFAPMIHDVASAYVRSARRLRARPDQAELYAKHSARASELFEDYLVSVPWQASQILNDLWDLEPRADRLAALVPNNYVAQRALYLFLMRKQLYADALGPLTTLRALNNEKYSEAELRRMSPVERREYVERSREDSGLRIAGEQLVLQGLLGHWSEHEALWPQYWSELERKQQREVAKALQQRQDGKLRLAEASLWRCCQEIPFAYEARLALADIYVSLGRWQELASVLSLLVYDQADVGLVHLTRALDLMRDMTPERKGNEFGKYDFVLTALQVRVSEKQRSSARKEHLASLKTFADLSAWNEANPDRAWIQRQLIDLYVGRVHELLGDFEAAAAAYRRGLSISPKNLWLRQRLAALPEPYGEADELSASLAKLVPGRHYFGSGICLLGYSFTPAIVPQLYTKTTVTHAWLCLDDISEDRSVQINFHNNGGRIYSDGYDFLQSDRPMVSWRVGEVWLQERPYQPLLAAYRQGGGAMWQNGPVASEITMRSANRQRKLTYEAHPRALVPVFTFSVKRE